MPRVRKGAARSQARKRILRLARGYYGVKHKHKYQAENALMRAGVYQFRDRRRLKRDMRRLWITRLTAAARMRGTRYSVLINGLKLAGVVLNRKMLSELAIHDPKTFDRITEMAVAAVKAKPVAPKTSPDFSGLLAGVRGISGTAAATVIAATAKKPAAPAAAKSAAPVAKGNRPTDIEDIEGIGPKFASMLAKADVKSISELLQAGRTAAGRETIAEKSGLKLDNVYSWVKAADLLRLDGVTPDWAELMIVAGVDSVKELAQRNAGNLLAAMTSANTAGPKSISPNLPSEQELSGFIGQAKSMPVGIES
jgi:large subunit ribosomal protein L20